LNYKANFLIILAGLPASGKTTFAFKLKEKLESDFQNNVKIIDPDILRDKAFPNGFDFKNESQIREKNVELIRKHLNKGYIVISDDLNYYSSMRHDLKLISDSLNIKFYIIHISTPLKVCMNRNEERGKPIPNNVIQNINNKFDNFNKYKWDTPFETYDITQNRDEIQFLKRLSDKIASNIQEQKEIKDLLLHKPSTSIREELDIITRKSVGELLKNPKYRVSKKAILEYRKSFVRSRPDEEVDVKKILEDFKVYLDKKLKV